MRFAPMLLYTHIYIYTMHIYIYIINGERTWYNGNIIGQTTDKREFKVVYANEEEACFLTGNEIITDIVCGDMELH